MARIIGEIESLNSIRLTLQEEGITQFSSLAEMKQFQKQYSQKRNKILIDLEMEWEQEAVEMERRLNECRGAYLKLKEHQEKIVNDKIELIKADINELTNRSSRYMLLKFFDFLRLYQMKRKLHRLIDGFDEYVSMKTNALVVTGQQLNADLALFKKHKQKIIEKRSAIALRQLDRTKKIIDRLQPQIAGAIGEDKVVNELKKLADSCTVINDFSVSFQPPIYHKTSGERISSIQVDHLLFTRAGIFVLETKNWSQRSIESLDLRSPVDQIIRTSYAVFVLANGDAKRKGAKVGKHHWGKKQIPVKSVVVLINGKPKEKFKFVTVLNLRELNGYIKYFDDLFTDQDVNNMVRYFQKLQKN